MTTEDSYSTKDLHLAAFLKLKGVELLRLERRETNGRDPVFFIFEDRYQCEYLEESFWKGRGEDITVNVKEYVDIIYDLKNQMSGTTS